MFLPESKCFPQKGASKMSIKALGMLLSCHFQHPWSNYLWCLTSGFKFFRGLRPPKRWNLETDVCTCVFLLCWVLVNNGLENGKCHFFDCTASVARTVWMVATRLWEYDSIFINVTITGILFFSDCWLFLLYNFHFTASRHDFPCLHDMWK